MKNTKCQKSYYEWINFLEKCIPERKDDEDLNAMFKKIDIKDPKKNKRIRFSDEVDTK